MADSWKYVSVTQFIEVDRETMLVLQTHILPCSEENHENQATVGDQGLINQGYGYWSEHRKQPYAWFTDQINQELLVCVHEVIYTKAVENLLCHRTQPKSSSAASNKPAYEFRRSNSLRMLMTFRPLKHRQHILFPGQSDSDQVLVPRAAILTEHGRRVLPYLNTSTFGGSGYRAYRVLPEALHVFVDKLELTSPRGIFKVLCLLDRKHPLSPDILSYFKQAAAVSSTEEGEQAEVLPQVPVAGLRRRVLGSKKRSTKLSTRSTRSKGSSMKQQAKSGQSQQQPTIITAFAKYQQVTEEQKEDGEDDGELLPDNILDDVWDFDLSQASTVVNEDAMSNNGHSLSDEEDVTEPPQQPLEDTIEYTVTRISPKVHGTKRQKSITAHCSSSTTVAKNKKAKLSKTASVTKPQDQVLANFNDPFDELAACQARKAKSESSGGVHIIKHQWVRIDEDEELEGTLKSTDTACATVNTYMYMYSTDEEEEFDMSLESHTSSLSKQQEGEYIEPVPSTELTSSLKLSSTASQQCSGESIETAATVKPTTSLNFSTKDIDEMLFGISTPDLSPAEFSETESDFASCSLEIVEHSVPRLARRSASQPATHCLSKDQDKATCSSWTRANSYSDSALDAELQVKFDDITNTVTSPRKNGAISPQKKSNTVPTRRSIVDLTQTTISEHVQSKVMDRKKKKKKPLPTSGVEIFGGAKRVADLSRQQLTDWMRLNQPVLMNIFKRKEYSWRHEEFNTNPKMRAAMKWRYDCRRFTDDQVKLITDILLKIFCWRHMKYFNYVMSVLLPESLVRVIADVHKVSFEEAEKLMFSFQGQARVDLTTD